MVFGVLLILQGVGGYTRASRAIARLIEDHMPDDLWALVEPLLPSPVSCSADDNGRRAEDGLASPNGLIRGRGITRQLRW